MQQQLLLALLGYAAQRGLPVDSLCAAAGLKASRLQSGKKEVVTPQQIERLWRQAEALSGDPLFGLHFGESMQLAALGVVGQLIQTSQTVGAAVTHAAAMIPLVTDLFRMEVQHHRQTFTVQLLPEEAKTEKVPHTVRHMADYLMVFVVHELDGLLLQKIEPLKVTYPYAVSAPTEYNRVFRCSVLRKKGPFSVELPRSYWDLTLLSAHYELQQGLLQQLHALRQEEVPGGALHQRIFHFLLTNAYLYTLSLESVAANFNTSPRSLQRRLKEEGVTFLQIVDEVRSRLARQYLQSPRYSIKDIAGLLGYNEPAAFTRAFRRWTGQPPGAFRGERQAR